MSVSPTVPTPSLTGVDEDRVRFLRACDRCRARKIRCDNRQPCTRCSAAQVQCTFSSNLTTTRPLISTARPSSTERGQSDVTGENDTGEHGKGKRKRSDAKADRPANEQVNTILNHTDTFHFFFTHEGLPRFAGSTSGLPLLDATQRLLISRRRPTAPQSEGEEPDWHWLASLLGNEDGLSPIATVDGRNTLEVEDLEYFPGRASEAGSVTGNVFSMVTTTIPEDLLASLIQIFFTTIHPSWPILHIQGFFADLHKSEDCSFAALVVSMCMLASRYTDDARALAESGVPASAGVQYFDLFKKLRERATNHDNVINAVQSLFFAAQFHCVDNIPHPIAQGLFAEAAARCLDGGLHREISAVALGSSSERETRSRTAWACYVWDKQLATICGRPPLLHVWDFDVSLPTGFENAHVTSDLPQDVDETHVLIFNQLVLVSAVLEKALDAYSQPPVYNNSDFLGKLSKSTRRHMGDAVALKDALESLDEWRSNLPSSMADRTLQGRAASPLYGLPSESVALTEHTVVMLLSARKLQLATLAAASTEGPTQLEDARNGLLSSARLLINSAVRLGSVKLLNQADILVAYRVLLSGRLLLACLLSARTDGNVRQEEEAGLAVHAAAVLLRHMAVILPITLGAAEVLDETCRVCGVAVKHVSKVDFANERRNKYAWHRPIGFRKNHLELLPGEDRLHSFTEAPLSSEGNSHNNNTISSELESVFPHHFSETLQVEQTDDMDFSWLLHGGSVPYYFPPGTA